MCWAIRTTKSGLLPDDPIIASFDGLSTGSGRQAFGIHRDKGRMVATPMRFGMVPPGPMGRRDLFWNARAEKLDKVTIWTRLNRQRCVIPISAFCENRPAETWCSGSDGYLIGLYDTDHADGGMVVVTEDDGMGGRRPVVTDEAGALAWIDANHWDITGTIARITRVEYGELDLFASKQMSADFRYANRGGRRAA